MDASVGVPEQKYALLLEGTKEELNALKNLLQNYLGNEDMESDIERKVRETVFNAIHQKVPYP